MVFKCKICGGNLEIGENRTITTCEYCGTKQTLPKLENDKVANLYDRANHFRRNNEYDKAEAVYEMILNEDSKDAEAYWSLILCKFGVEYVEDPRTHEYIPTCNRTQNTSILTDENYKQALKYANNDQKELYKTEAEKINQIQKEILEISNKEEPFDVFICYKETDENGKRTQDSVIAQEIYYQLQKEGLKVFFAKITLENKIGQSYEPYIFAALNSAKVMLVLGTKKEYLEATWVKNEWSRYLALIKNGEEKTLIPCFKEMDAYDLPEEFAYLQSQDMSKLGFEQDLLHGVKKLVNKEEKKEKSKAPKILLIAIILLLLIIGSGAILFFSPEVEIEAQTATTQKQEQREIIRQDITAVNGYTFTVTEEELIEKLKEKIEQTEYKDLIEIQKIETEGEYTVVGWFYDETKLNVVGIQFVSHNGYVSSVMCTPAEYGSGDISSLAVPENLYEEAKRILGSQTEEWKKLEEENKIIEETTDRFTGEEITDGTFYCGMIKNLRISQ